jgi:hypothetical protein
MIAPSDLHAIGAELTTETDETCDGFERLQDACEELAALWDAEPSQVAGQLAAILARASTFLRLQRQFDIRHR